MEKGTEDLKQNPYGQYFDELRQQLEGIGDVLAKIHASAQLKREKAVAVMGTNKDAVFNFEVQSLFVDNSANGTPVTVTAGRVNFKIGANAQTWIHPLGGRQFSADQTVTVIAVNEFLPI